MLLVASFGKQANPTPPKNRQTKTKAKNKVLELWKVIYLSPRLARIITCNVWPLWGCVILSNSSNVGNYS